MACSGSFIKDGVMAALVCLAAVGCVEIDERPTSWAHIHTAIIEPNCATSNCHSTLAATAGLQFNTIESAYFYLTGQPCDETDSGTDDVNVVRNFVNPYQPDSSKLMYMLRGQSVYPMPPDVSLPDSEIAIVERWILEGAECN